MGIGTIPEMFETYDESGAPLGLVARDIVHREGIWHKAANVFLFRTNGHLLIQRRQQTKDVCPGLWDVSVAEHLQPNENFEQGAMRGLLEELGLAGIQLTAIGDTTREQLELPALGLKDYEFQQSFRAVSDKPCEIDEAEVAEIKDISLMELQSWMTTAADEFTPWFHHRVRDLRLFD